jgi:hypothetical protein
MDFTQPTPTSNQSHARVAMVHIAALEVDPHFKWFVENVLERERDVQRDAALALTKTPLERDYAAHSHAVMLDLCRRLKSLRDTIEPLSR